MARMTACVGDVEGTVRHRKHPVSPFHLQRHAQRLEKRHGVPRREPCQRTVQKSPITGNAGKQRLPVTVIGHIAPALAGDVHLFAEALVWIEQRHVRTLARGADRGHHAARATTGDDALAMSLSHLTKIPIQWIYLTSDLIVLGLSLTYIPVRRIGYSLLTVILSGQLIGLMQRIKGRPEAG